MEVRSPGYLHFYKDKKAASDAAIRSRDPAVSADATAVVVDLRNVIDFSISEKGAGKGNVVLDMQLGNDTVRLK